MMAPTLPRSSRAHRPSGSEMVFADADGRLWSAAVTSSRDSGRATGAVVFACITDAREPVRARALDEGDDQRVADLDDATLCAWLEEAPRIGRLT